jgi:hypothetical protein
MISPLGSIRYTLGLDLLPKHVETSRLMLDFAIIE